MSGWSWRGTPYVAFADDDSWWAEGSLKACADVFDTHPGVGLVAGRVLVGPEERLDPLCALMARSPLPAGPRTPGVPIPGFMACGAVMRREAFLQAGGFDPVTFFCGEEDRLAWDMAAYGWQLFYVNPVVAHHHPQQSDVRQGRKRMLTRKRPADSGHAPTVAGRGCSVVAGESLRHRQSRWRAGRARAPG